MAFIVFEGIDGSGKSTLIEGLKKYVESKGHNTYLTREPGGTALAEDIRKIIIQLEGEDPVPRAELLLYQAARAQHVETVIKPNIANGVWVLCDRFTSSTLAFQAGGRKLDEDDIVWLNDYATGKCYPDVWVLLDLPVEESQKRREQRCLELGIEQDRFEQEKNNFHEDVRQHYLKQVKADPKNWVVLDATGSREALLEQLIEKLKEHGWLQ